LATACLEELGSFLQKKPRELTVVTMPDFFLDRLVSLRSELKAFYEDLTRVAKRKGGAIDNIAQEELRGGNAINTASALAALGVNVVPIVCTNKLGLQLIRFYLKSRNVDLSHVKLFDDASITTALEFQAEGKKVNVMLREVGSLAQFRMQDVNSDDLEAIENADYTCVFNWVGTRHFGTELAEGIFHHAKTRGKGKTYYDTADPTPNPREIPKLVKSVLCGQDVDILSLNENEAVCYASHISKPAKTTGLPFDQRAKEAAKALAAHAHARVDLHTTNFSATFAGTREASAPAFNVPVLRATGAGDAWNAGNILADAHQLPNECRLTLANAVAASYISSPSGTHATLKQLAKFCAKMKKKREAS
jgi:sugar/nucleoside kinase (ribokinase family)